jgi:hypothetical protein
MLRLGSLANGNEKLAFLPADLALESQYIA